MAIPAKSVLNMIKDLQSDVDRLTKEIATLKAEGIDKPGSNTDHEARLDTLEKIIWGVE